MRCICSQQRHTPSESYTSTANTKTLVRNQAGFTLIEVLAVLIILGIMAGVAVPKFFSMQEQAERKTLEIALNDMKSRATLAYTQSLLTNDGSAVDTDYDTFGELGLAAADPCADCRAAYKDFAGTWEASTNTTIKYQMANGTAGTDDVATFTLTPGVNNPSTIAIAYADT